MRKCIYKNTPIGPIWAISGQVHIGQAIIILCFIAYIGCIDLAMRTQFQTIADLKLSRIDNV